MSDTKHSELPWRHRVGRIIAPDTSGGRPSTVHVGLIGAFDDKELLRFNKERWIADCDLICIAVNAHYDLVAAITEAITVLESWNDDEINVELMPQLRAALAKAQPQTGVSNG